MSGYASRRAIYGAMAGDTTLDGLLASPPTGYAHSVYYQVAPDEADYPFVIFNRQAGTPSYALGGKTHEAEVWLIKAVDRSDTADAADAIAARLNALLTDASLSISGATQLYLRRESDIDYAEVVDGVTYRHAGSNFRLISK